MGEFDEKMKTKNFSGVRVLDLSIKVDEESPWFLEGRNLISQNGFLTIDLVDWDISGSIFIFEIGWAETEILQSEDFGR